MSTKTVTVRETYVARFFTETTRTEVEGRDVAAAVAALQPYEMGFSFFDQQVETHKTTWGEEKTDYGPRLDETGIYYPGGTLYMRDQVLDPTGEFAGESFDILRSNVENNNVQALVKTRSGNLIQFHPDRDHII
jgi:hypothetical protein